jgi:hypothetical protein
MFCGGEFGELSSRKMAEKEDTTNILVSSLRRYGIFRNNKRTYEYH